MNVEAVIVVLIASLVGPAFLSWLNNRQTMAREDRANRRQDAIDARLTENNSKLTQLQRSADEIHVLVNSNLTERMRAELDATVRELVALREIMELKRAAGQEPTADALRVITATVATIAEMRAVLSDRLEIQARIDAARSAENQ